MKNKNNNKIVLKNDVKMSGSNADNVSTNRSLRSPVIFKTILLTLVLVFFSSCKFLRILKPGVERTKSNTAVCAPGGIDIIDANISSGDIVIKESSTVTDIEYEYEIKVVGIPLSSVEEALEKAVVTAYSLSNKFIIVATGDLSDESKDIYSVSYDITITVPSTGSFDYNIKTSTGSVDVTDIFSGGSLRLTSDTGSVSVTDSGNFTSLIISQNTGSISINDLGTIDSCQLTGNTGRIEIDDTGLIKELKAVNDTGSILIDEVTLGVAAITNDTGRIRMNVCGGDSVTVVNDTGSIRLGTEDLNSGSSYYLYTDTGTITIDIDSSEPVEYGIVSDSFDYEDEFDFSESGEDVYMAFPEGSGNMISLDFYGKIGSGSSSIYAETDTGSVDLEDND